MTKKVVLPIITFFIVLGVVALSINTIFGATAMSYITPIRIEGTDTWIYKYDLQAYINNITINLSDTSVLTLTGQTREWISTATISNWYDVLINNLAFILNALIYFLNILVWPLRVGGYLAQTMLTIYGLNFINPPSDLQWLADLLTTLKSTQIPYI